MTSVFRAHRGHAWHVVHVSYTQAHPGQTTTLCGKMFLAGDLEVRGATCLRCLDQDNPLMMAPRSRDFLREYAAGRFVPPTGQLLAADYVTSQGVLTARGEVLAADFREGAVPLADERGVVHLREPLVASPYCRMQSLPVAAAMSFEHYRKLRALRDQLMPTCLLCLGREGP